MKTTLNASSRIMHEEAQKMGISCVLLGDKETIFMEKGTKKWLTRGSRTSLQSSVGKSLADNKNLTKKVLNFFNLPTAKHVFVSSSDHLERLRELLFPVVMKPIGGTHGKGVIVGISTFEKASEAFENQNESVIFEELLQGIEYRVVCVNFKFTAAAFRKPAFVVGDGTHTIEELVAIKNQHPWRGDGHESNLTFISFDNLVHAYLKDQGFKSSDTPPKETEVFLRKTANLSTGGEAWDMTDSVCPENIVLFEKIARACDLNTIGIDVMCSDLNKPIVDQPKAGIIEVNSSPGLRMHHYPIVGTPRNIAGEILSLVLNTLDD